MLKSRHIIVLLLLIAVSAILVGNKGYNIASSELFKLSRTVTTNWETDGNQPFFQRRQDWDAEHKHCKILMERPVPFPIDQNSCRRVRDTVEDGDFRCPDGRLVMFSQFHQDYLLYKYHFKYLRRSGHYLDVAANDPQYISNSYFFDRCLGWSGLCVEPQTEFHDPLHRLRSCTVLPTCVTDAEHDGEIVNFLIKGGTSGIDTTHKLVRKNGNTDSYKKMIIRCTTLAKELRRYGKRILIDYMSLDVEGHELPILRGIDWNTTKINVISIEVGGRTYPPINAFLTSLGFKELRKLPDGRSVRHATYNSDVVYLGPGVEFGRPE